MAVFFQGPFQPFLNNDFIINYGDIHGTLMPVLLEHFSEGAPRWAPYTPWRA